MLPNTGEHRVALLVDLSSKRRRHIDHDAMLRHDSLARLTTGVASGDAREQ